MAQRPSRKTPARASAPDDGPVKGGARIRQEPRGRAEATTPAPSPPIPTLGEIVGQARAVSALEAAIRSGRLHHAWLFHGPPGVGKFTTAKAFANALLDPACRPEAGGDSELARDSPTRRWLNAGTHPDLHIITRTLARFSRDPETRQRKLTNIPVEVIREFLIEPAMRSAASGAAGALARRVFIVDEAERLDPRSQDTMLQTLEEPPPGVVIMLITASEDRLRPTVRSRTRRVPFGPLSHDDLLTVLARHGVDMQALDEDARQWVLEFADGSPGLALLALESGVAAWPRVLTPLLLQTDCARLPATWASTIWELIETWVATRLADHNHARNHADPASPDDHEHEPSAGPSGNDDSGKTALTRTAMRLMFCAMAGHYRAALRTAREATDLERAAAAIEHIRHSESLLEANVPPLFVLEDLGVRLATR